MILSDKRVKECEFQLHMLKQHINRLEGLLYEMCDLRKRVSDLEKSERNNDIQMEESYGRKFSFSYSLPGGQSHYGQCNEIKSLPQVVERVRKLGGFALCIKDETDYFKWGKFNTNAKDPVT